MFHPVKPRIIDNRTPEQKAKAEAKRLKPQTNTNTRLFSCGKSRPRWRMRGGSTGDVEPE